MGAGAGFLFSVGVGPPFRLVTHTRRKFFRKTARHLVFLLVFLLFFAPAVVYLLLENPRCISPIPRIPTFRDDFDPDVGKFALQTLAARRFRRVAKVGAV